MLPCCSDSKEVTGRCGRKKKLCVAAAAQTHANMFEIWHPDASEVHAVAKDNVRNKAKAVEDSQTVARHTVSTPRSLIPKTTNRLLNITVTLKAPALRDDKV
ncbi:hypothetical protein F2P81_016208 [Scophthalmus maximus]|uniref:Uncharacterized protein n=1 Tax=Scophthalmus maximus TaxID=52904 RepID=A0A6A4SBW4_SCOMX|nr:hypothetical protein F2P81_016208 [Scophthalmus maximus]